MRITNLNAALAQVAIGLAAIAILAAPVAARAQDAAPGGAQFFKDKEEGWFWKKSPPEPEIPPKAKPQPPAPAKPKPAPEKEKAVKEDEAKKPFSVAWLRANMGMLLDRAIDKPTPENIAAYMYAQRIAMDKSQVFAETAQRVVLSDPLLDENNRTSLATFGRLATMRATSAARETVLKRLSTVGGLWFFYDTTCSYCVDMAETMINFEAAYGFHTKFISMDNRPIKGVKTWVKDEGQARRLELTITPSLVFVVPPNNYYVISQGIMSLSDIAERILVAAENRDMLSQAELRALYPQRSGILTAQDTEDGATDDPVALVTNIRKKILGGSYGIQKLPEAP